MFLFFDFYFIFCFSTYYEPDEKLHISLFSKGALGKIIFLGKTSVKLSKLKNDEINHVNYQIKDGKDTSNSGKIELIIQKHCDYKKGFLAHYGKPLEVIPQRVDYGDLLFFHSKGIVGGATRVATGSNVTTFIFLFLFYFYFILFLFYF